MSKGTKETLGEFIERHTKAFVTIEGRGRRASVVVYLQREGRPEISKSVVTTAELDAVLAGCGEVTVSSSIDFPEDSTRRKDVLAICKHLRPDGWLSGLEGAIARGEV